MVMGNVLVLACGKQTSAPFLHVLEITILHSGFPLNKECLKNKKACMTSHCLLQTKLRLLYSALIFTLDGITLASSYTVRNLGVTFTSIYPSVCTLNKYK